MSYEPTNWKSGDVVTSAKLNKMEQGIASAGGPVITTTDDDTGAIGLTWQEVYNAMDAGNLVLIKGEGDENGISFNIVTSALGNPSEPTGGYMLFINNAEAADLACDSANGYPVWK